MIFGHIILEARPSDSNSVLTALLPIIVVTAIVVVRRSNRPKRRAAAATKPAATFVPTTHPVIMPRAGGGTPSRVLSPIESIRHLLGPAPRTFDPGLGSYLTVLPPKWLEKSPADEMWLNVKHQERVRRDGQVVWATIVQANNNLFKLIAAESGASVIYSPDPFFDGTRVMLRSIAGQCFATKGTDPADPESAVFARMLTNEMTRGMRLKVPGAFTSGRQVFHSSMLMPRKHLPKGVLSGSFFPVWIDPQNTGAVVMVPAAYWPASLTAEWDKPG